MLVFYKTNCPLSSDAFCGGTNYWRRKRPFFCLFFFFSLQFSSLIIDPELYLGIDSSLSGTGTIARCLKPCKGISKRLWTARL